MAWLLLMAVGCPASATRCRFGRAGIAGYAGLGQDSLVMEALDSGAKDFIVKPFQPEKVLDVVLRILKERKDSDS